MTLNDTPVYNELVAKFYLSKGLKPFTCEPIKPKVTVADIRKHMGPKATVHDYVTLMTPGNKAPDAAEAIRAVKYDYFRL